jgi:ABC-type multidrug transport system ATPase subunit
MELFNQDNLYTEHPLFNNLSIKLKNNHNYILLMPNNSGKTTLTNYLNSNLNHYLVKETLVSSETITLKHIASLIPKTKANQELIIQLINTLNKPKTFLKRPLNELSAYERILIELIIAKVLDVDYLVVDNSLVSLTNYYQKKIFDDLNILNIKTIYFTHNINTVNLNHNNLYYVINHGHIIKYGNEEILKEAELFISNNLIVPFYLRLSHNLKVYNLINDNYLTKESLGDALCE